MRKACAVLLVLLILGPSLAFGQVMSGTVGLLGMGPGWYVGARRLACGDGA